jgi:hypothetical protein
LELLYETGADLRCFSHTRDEVRGVLETCASRVQVGDSEATYGPEILRNFRSMGYSRTDVIMLSNNLERDLEALRIRVVDKPAHAEREHQVDEDALREKLEESINYSRPQQISRDVDSISAIMRLRRGRQPFRLEECRALFVTTNSTLAVATQQYFFDGSNTRAVSPCLTDYALTNLLWLKRPTAAPDLPRKRIIADCYAATRPTEQLWRLFLAEIEKLNQGGEVTLDEYLMLRHSLGAETALMDVTMGEEKGFTQGTVPEVLERVRSNMEAKKQAEVDAEKASREVAERELEAARERDIHRRHLVKSRAQRWASRTVWVLKFFLLGVLALATAFTFPWDLPSFTSLWGRYLLTIILLVLFVFSVATFWNGTTVEGLARQLEVALARWIERRLLALIEDQ